MKKEMRTKVEASIRDITRAVYGGCYDAIADIEKLAEKYDGLVEISDYYNSGEIRIDDVTWEFEIWNDSFYTNAVSITEKLTDEQWEAMYFGK